MLSHGNQAERHRDRCPVKSNSSTKKSVPVIRYFALDKRQTPALWAGACNAFNFAGRSSLVETVINTDTRNVVGNVGAPTIRAENRVRAGRTYVAKVDVEVFNFPGPIARIRDCTFDTRTRCPAELGLRRSDDRRNASPK